MLVDFNHGSSFVYGSGYPAPDANQRINALVDQALVEENQRQIPRDYLGASRIGDPCARKLAYEFTHTPPDPGKAFDGAVLRIFAAGHLFEDLAIRWLRVAGFDLRTSDNNGGQFGFETAAGRIKGHIDGIIVGGPDVSVTWPALLMGVGVAFVLGGLLEMGVGIMAVFGLWLAHNLQWLAFWDYWPFAILLVAVLVAVGYLRARAAADNEK